MFQHEKDKNQEEQQRRSQDGVGGRQKNPSSEHTASTMIGTVHSNTPSSSAAAAFLYARMWNGAKYMMALAFFCDAVLRLQGRMLFHPSSVPNSTTASPRTSTTLTGEDESLYSPIIHDPRRHRRVLQEAVVGGSSNNNSIRIIDNNTAPSSAATAPVAGTSYMKPLFEDLRERQKLFTNTPPEEIKYWFEYTGPMQKYYYRHSKMRSSPDYFEGRDDSGVVSSRFIRDFGGTREHAQLFHPSNNIIQRNGENVKDGNDQEDATMDDDVTMARRRLLENCIAMGHPTRSNKIQELWKRWHGNDDDRCRILFAINMVGAGGRAGTGGVGPHRTLFDTTPPHPNDDSDLYKEQAGAASHLKRNFQEINAMCASGLVSAKIQVLVCEPIHPQWIEWMDAHLVQCGGMVWPDNKRVEEINNVVEAEAALPAVLEDRPSPVQIVVAGPLESAEQCHDAKSGFMEQRMQGLILKTSNGDDQAKARLVSNGTHDLHVSLKWSTLVTMRAVASFLQASADLQVVPYDAKKVAAGKATTMIPSFVRVSYLSEENVKEAKWRMHGDFFHPAAYEICKDSYSMSWIPNSLAGYSEARGEIRPICPQANVEATRDATSPRKLGSGSSCGQWWISFNELQMPTSPEIYANEQVPSIVSGGSNFFWMLTERQRQQIVKKNACEKAKAESATTAGCPSEPQGVIPLGDLQSFLINFTPNTALGKKHVKDRRPGYSKEEELDAKRKALHERGTLQTKGGDTKIETALFEYTVYPTALFHKDATLMAARQRDAVLSTKNKGDGTLGPQLPTTVKSSYYDITIIKPRPPVLGWCQAMARRGLCTLFANYFRTSSDARCMEACGLKWNFTPLEAEAE